MWCQMEHEDVDTDEAKWGNKELRLTVKTVSEQFLSKTIWKGADVYYLSRSVFRLKLGSMSHKHCLQSTPLVTVPAPLSLTTAQVRTVV